MEHTKHVIVMQMSQPMTSHQFFDNHHDQPNNAANDNYDMISNVNKHPQPPHHYDQSQNEDDCPQRKATTHKQRTDPDIEGTKPNHLGPVFCGPWCQFRLIQTGFFV